MALNGTGNAAGKALYNNILYSPSGIATVAVDALETGFVLNGNAYRSGTAFKCTIGSTNYTTLAAWKTAVSGEANGTAFTTNQFLDGSVYSSIVPTNYGLAEALALVAGSQLLTAGVNLTSSYSITLPATDIVGSAISASALAQGAINFALSYSLTGPTTGVKGVASTAFTITPSALTSDTITLSDGGSGGVFTPSSVVFADSSSAATFTYTPPTVGTFTLTLTSGFGAAISGEPATYTATPAYVWQYIQSNHGSGSPETSQAVTFTTKAVTAGNLIVVAITNSVGETFTVTDNKGNTYTHAIDIIENNDLWYSHVTTGGSVTVTVTGTTTAGLTVAIGEYAPPPGSTISLEHHGVGKDRGSDHVGLDHVDPGHEARPGRDVGRPGWREWLLYGWVKFRQARESARRRRPTGHAVPGLSQSGIKPRYLDRDARERDLLDRCIGRLPRNRADLRIARPDKRGGR